MTARPVPEVFVRPATPADVETLAAVELHTALTAYADIFPPEAPAPTRDEFAARWRTRLDRAAAGVGIFVAVSSSDRSIVGTVMADPEPEDRGNIQSLYVDPDHWGLGIGHRLHDTAREYLRIARPQLPTLWLWVLEANKHARACYESWGWHQTPARRTVYPGIDDLRYESPQ